MAREEVAALRCPATLQQCDFVNALARWTDPVDFVWVGQWLHHLMAANKLGTMREIRRVLPPCHTSDLSATDRDGDTQDDWTNCFEWNCYSVWSAMSEAQ